MSRGESKSSRQLLLPRTTPENNTAQNSINNNERFVFNSTLLVCRWVCNHWSQHCVKISPAILHDRQCPAPGNNIISKAPPLEFLWFIDNLC